MSVKHGILGILARQPRHGYELKNAFEELSGGFWELNFGQIYTTLERLAKEGLVQVVEDEESKGERRVYRITDKGQKEFHEWLQKPVSRPKPIRDELLVKLAFIPSEDLETMIRIIDCQRQLYLERMQLVTRRRFELAQQGSDQDHLIAGLLVDHALFHAEADLRWLDHFEGTILARQKKRP
ncbi:MAG: PadR family transcriptional regulator [Bacillota bacterium]